MTVCNMSIEGGARCGYVNPDETTYEYLRGPRVRAERRGVGARRRVLGRDALAIADAHYDDVVAHRRGEDIEPIVTWGITPGQAVRRRRGAARARAVRDDERAGCRRGLPIHGASSPGSRSRARRSTSPSSARARTAASRDFAEVGAHRGAGQRRAARAALVVPGSQQVREAPRRRACDKVFRDAGFELREAGCSMCLAMNPDKLLADELCASSSNRNFKGRQGSPTGRTLLMSPVMVAAAAIAGEVADARELFAIERMPDERPS